MEEDDSFVHKSVNKSKKKGKKKSQASSAGAAVNTVVSDGEPVGGVLQCHFTVFSFVHREIARPFSTACTFCPDLKTALLHFHRLLVAMSSIGSIYIMLDAFVVVFSRVHR